MDEFKEYIRFPDFETANEYIDVLTKNNIPFKLDDASMRFKLVASNNPLENQFILKLKDTDIEKAEAAFEKEVDNEVKNLPPDHYLYTFSDKDIIELIANQNDWTKSEIKLALEIASTRKLDLSAASLKSAKLKPDITLSEKNKNEFTLEKSSSWLWYFGVFSVINSILFRLRAEFYFPGLTITESIDSYFGSETRIGFFICLAVATIFFLLAKFGKSNKWVFLIGLTLIVFDSILRVFSHRWILIIFNFLAIWSMAMALINTMKSEKNAA